MAIDVLETKLAGIPNRPSIDGVIGICWLVNNQPGNVRTGLPISNSFRCLQSFNVPPNVRYEVKHRAGKLVSH